jgi:hypothetical protein
MNWHQSWRAIAALGISLAAIMAAGVPPSAAQTPPRPLQNQARPDQQDRQFDRQDYGRGYDARDPRGVGRGENRVERRLEFLHTQLRITPSQEMRWGAFAAVVREGAGSRDFRRPGDDRSGAPSVVDRLEQRERMLADRSAGIDRILNALRPLYASFNEEQRRTADRLMFQQEGGRGGPQFRGGRGEPDSGRGGRFDSRGGDSRDDRGYR